MQIYNPPLEDFRFLLETLGYDRVHALAPYESYDQETALAILETAGKFCREVALPLNGVGDRSLRRNLESFFNPGQPLGTRKGNLFTLRLGVGKLLGETQNITVGVEGYGELDLTDRSTRPSRMTNVGAHAYMRFRIFGKAGRSYSPPAYGRGRS